MPATAPSLPVHSAAAPAAAPATGGDGFVDRFGGRYYRIAHAERLPTFFMNVVSPSDVWLFLAGNGALTAGRGHAEHAIFPYQTVDKIQDSAPHTGGVSALWCETGGDPILWEPFAAHGARHGEVERHLYKSVEGDRVWLEEIHPALGLAYRVGWTSTEAHGLVRQVEIANLGEHPRELHVLDGVRNLRVPGVSLRLHGEYSCLTDAYKTAELAPGGVPLGLFALAAGIVDRAIPMESLRATTVWADGLPEARVHLHPAAAEDFVRGRALRPAAAVRGVRAAFALEASLVLAPGATRRWRLVLDTERTQAQAAALARRLDEAPAALSAELDAALAENTGRLRALVASADGLQAGGDEVATAHHFANTLFNIMRGGVFAFGHEVDSADFADYLRIRNVDTSSRHAALVSALPPRLPRADFLARLAPAFAADPDLERFALEYLPLTFSRRHGDPSRPWNKFHIRVRDDAGRRVLNHEGNWRDIFQNWEALCLSFPDFCEAVIAKFLNASTADGYNPYRITRAGIDWEVPEPHDPWASIGYWGDHQTIYLQKLLEWSGRFHPGLLVSWLRRPLFAYAAVPYRIAPYADIRRDPRSTIAFDEAAHRAILAREAALGSDARLLAAPGGGVLHVTLAEKLLLLALVRLGNLVPGAGIWMNTQRPEWNDANNALVGNGVSVVTLAYLRRFLSHLRDTLLPAAGDAPFPLSTAVANLLAEVAGVLARHEPRLRPDGFDDAARRAFVDAVGEAASRHRARVYASGPGAPREVPAAEVRAFVERALAFVDHSLRANRREDGLWHGYNLLRFDEQPARLSISRLAPMLEGQVAVLSSGLLSPGEAADLLRALRASPLYRADQHSYLLYPDKTLAAFLERNRLPAGAAEAEPLLRELLARGDTRLVERDAGGVDRFHADLVNADALRERLDLLARDHTLANLVAASRSAVETLYEEVFHHHAFTGRSSSMFGYEGLGCIYWHMVAKLLLAVQENQRAAERAGDPAAAELAARYAEIRDGLGYRKSAAVYGAFPTDPYSHTPGQAGAQQPGMTGQVKEELLTRLGEIGVCIEEGTVEFVPSRLDLSELALAPARLDYLDHAERLAALEIPPGCFGFTLCGTPILYRRGLFPHASLRVHLSGAEICEVQGTRLPPALGSALLSRTRQVHLVEANYPG